MASEDKKPEGAPEGDNPLQARAATALSYIPRKFAELKTFLSDVRSELRRVTWPPKTEVYPTTIVVIVTTIIFGVLLYSVDVLFSKGLAALLKQV
ncbi:MAG: preprotein translocase subunit SecE [Vicinamibacteria bacterium]|nr:preprotein translocase subunit SecE [Vicinamibacteria bacterium]